MKSAVSYERAMRDQATSKQMGLYTLDFIRAGREPGKLGSRITLQGPIDAEEEKAISDFIVQFLEKRNAKKPG